MSIDMEIRAQSPEPAKGTVYSLLTSVSHWMAVMSCITLMLMMFVVCVDVLGRDLFNWPLRGASEIVGLLLILAATWGLGVCQVEKSHLRVLLIYDLFPRRVQVVLDLLAYLVCFASSGIITWQILRLAIKYQRLAIGDTTPTLGLPFAPFILVMAIGFGWLTLILIRDIYLSMKEVLKK
jgi:TRAP-type C4-dicarboxylate transport system permease small subunit